MRTGKVLVVSLNPAIDCEWEVERVLREEKNNILSERRWAGGKGSNVVRWLMHFGVGTELLLPLGGATGKELAGYLKNVRTRIVPIKQPTRVNIIVSARTGGQLRFNPLGPILSRSEWQTVMTGVKKFCRDAVIFSGALPRGVPGDAYKTLIELSPAEPILDCDGEAFNAGIQARPALVKPNEHELQRWWGQPVRNPVQAVARLSDMTGGWVAVSQGRRGALLWNSSLRTGFRANAPKVAVRNTVGAGDAMLAAMIWKKRSGASPAEWLRWGVAAGTAAVACEGGVLPSLKAIRELVGLTQARPLTNFA